MATKLKKVDTNQNARDKHEALRSALIKDGWTLGPHWDCDKKWDPRLVPFDQLPENAKVKESEPDTSEV